VGGILLYLYKMSQKNGGTLAGTGMNVNPERIAGLAAQFVPHDYRPHAKEFGTAVINRFFNKGTVQ
jgi:hypothetical protein